MLHIESQKPKPKNTTMAPRRTKKEQAVLRKATLEKEVAAKRATAVPEASISEGDNQEDDESTSKSKNEERNMGMEVIPKTLTTNDDEKSIKWTNTSGKSGAQKRKSLASASTSKASMPTKGSKRLVSSPNSKCRKILSTMARKPRAKAKDYDDTYSETDIGDDDNRKLGAVPRQSPRPSLLKEVQAARGDEDSDEDENKPPQPEEMEQQRATLWAMLIKTEERVHQAEQQVRTISRTTRITDSFLEGQVLTWTKETLWKMCKFITNDQTMHQVMQKASKHFKVPAFEQEHWMASYSHIVRDGLNQKRNACSQDLRKTIKSKCHELHYCC